MREHSLYKLRAGFEDDLEIFEVRLIRIVVQEDEDAKDESKGNREVTVAGPVRGRTSHVLGVLAVVLGIFALM